MNISLTVAQIYSAFIFIMGLSLTFQSHRWAEFSLKFKNDNSAVLSWGTVSLPFILVVVLTHQLWALTPTVLITILGWISFIKIIILLIAPNVLMSIYPASHSTILRWIRIEGPILAIIGIILLYYTFVDISPLYSVVVEIAS